MGEESVSALRDLYASFNRRDVNGIVRMLDPDVVVDETEDLAYAAALLRVLGPRFVILSAGYQGVDEVASLFRTVWEISEWFEVEPLEFIQMEDLVVVPLALRAKSRGDGRQGEAETAHLWTMENGRAVRLRVFPRGDDAVAAGRPQLKARAGAAAPRAARPPRACARAARAPAPPAGARGRARCRANSRPARSSAAARR